MPERDTASQPFHDLLSAIGLLTRLPMIQTNRHRPDAAWCWPLIGLIAGLISLLPALILLEFGVSPATSAAVIIMSGLLVTGAMHEDGLADSADGLFGGWTKDRRLEIMKDSHIGSYGTLALIAVLLGIWSSYNALLVAGDWAAILSAMVLSRASMSVIMALLPNARDGGLSSTVGRPSKWAAGLSVAIAGGIAVGLVQDWGLWCRILAATALMAFTVAGVAYRKIGGQTGDILGASQQLSLLGALIAAQM